MINLILKKLIPPNYNPNNPNHRQDYGIKGSIIGIGLNFLLCLCKCTTGLLIGSIAILGDGLNNLSDAGASFVSLFGFRLSNLRPDKEHPFGHGRFEYLSGLLVAVLILFMGSELAQSAFFKLFQPESIVFSWVAVYILIFSILIKIWMSLFYKRLSREIDSTSLKAASIDAKADSIATFVVLVSTLIEHYYSLNIDAYAGLMVSIFILHAGWNAIKDALDPLLGRPIPQKLITTIEELVETYPEIIGIHDIIYHDYGPGRSMMSFHAEVPATGNFLELHDIIDIIESDFKKTYQINTVIHMDPVVNDQRTHALQQQIQTLLTQMNPQFTLHDFRTTAGHLQTKIFFDVLVPYEYDLTDMQVKKEIEAQIIALNPKFIPSINIDHTF